MLLRGAVVREEVHRGRVLGKGTFGTVFEGSYGGKRVAMKELSEGVDKALSEAMLMQ